MLKYQWIQTVLGGVTMNDQKKIGAFITQARERQGISRGALAHILHVDEAEIADWEGGNAYPPLAQAPVLARELSVSLDELFNARYHTVAQEYQAPEESFFPEAAAPEPLPEPEAPKETPLSKAPAPLHNQEAFSSCLPRWSKAVLAVCLSVEGAAGGLLVFAKLTGALLALAIIITVAAAIAVCAAAAYLFVTNPQMRRRAALLPVPSFLLLLLIWMARLLF